MKKTKGFTLIELLVVIAIIALLLSIVMPALSKVKQQARVMVCMTNIKSLTTASMTYAVENDDRYPLNGSRDSNGNLNGYPQAPFWEARLMPYIDYSYNIDPSITTDEPGSPLESYGTTTFEVILCPNIVSDSEQRYIVDTIRSGQSTRAVNKYPKSYRMNGMITGHAGENGPFDSFGSEAYRDSLKTSQVVNSGGTVLLADSWMIDGMCFNSLYGWAIRMWGDIAPAHFIKYDQTIDASFNPWNYPAMTGRANIGFADGHVDWIKREYTPDYWQNGGEEGTAGIKFYAR